MRKRRLQLQYHSFRREPPVLFFKFQLNAGHFRNPDLWLIVGVVSRCSAVEWGTVPTATMSHFSGFATQDLLARAEHRMHFLDHGFNHNAAIDTHLFEFTPSKRVVGSLCFEQVNSVFFPTAWPPACAGA